MALAVGAAFAFFAVPVFANPSGATVAHGGATFSVNGNTLSIANTPGAIINWQQFSIGKDEITRFIQQNAASSVLNRVTSQNPSSIVGQLLSNGRVFLINPSGIAFGQGAVIDVAGFAASTLSISDADFISGRMRFIGIGDEGKLTNAGTIRTPEGGHVYLIAPKVENQASGVITSPKGEVVIAAGKSVELVNARTPEIRVELTAPDNEAVNAGDIIAASGRVGVYGTLIRNSGLVSASRAEVGEGGKIVFKAVKDVTLDATSRVEASGAKGGAIKVQAETGTLLAQGVVEARGEQEKGGAIQLLAKQVGLIGNTTVDASGKRGGGTVLVGGDYQGKNPTVQNAEKTYIGSDAAIRANANTAGDGGTIIVWADQTARVHGSISARGASGGSGGFVETSGLKGLEVTRTPDAGTGGTWLLDPETITITSAQANITQSAGVEGGSAEVFAPTAPDTTTTIDVANVNAALNSGVNVRVHTTSAGTTTAGDIIVDAAIAKSLDGGAADGAMLTLQADRDININQSITSTAGALGVTLQAARDISVGAQITSNNGTVSLRANDSWNTTAIATGKVTVNGSIDAGTGAISLTNNGGSGTHVISAGLTGQGITVTGPASVTAAITLNAGSGNLQTGDLTLNAASPLTLQASGVGTVQTGSIAGTTANIESVTFNAGGTVTVTGAVGTGAVPLNEVRITQSGGTTFQSTVDAANVVITDTADAATVAFQDNLTVGTGMTVAANGAYHVSITGAANSIAGTTTFNNGGTLTVGDAATDSTTFVGGVTATAPSGVSLAGSFLSTNTAINLGDANTATVLTDDAIFNTGNSGDVSVGGMLLGTVAGAEDLTVSAGTGNVTFAGAVGGVRLGHVLITGAADVLVNDVAATSIRQAAGTGTTTLNGAVDVNGVVPTTAAGVVLANDRITVSATSTMATAGGDVFLAGDDMSLDGAAGVINTGGGHVTLTTQSAGQTITLGGAGGLSLVTSELNSFANAPTVTIGTDGSFLSTPAHTGTIAVSGATDPNSAGLMAFNITNAGTSGDSVIFNASLTTPKPVTVSTAAGNIKFNAAGKILANGATAADRVVNLVASTGSINGNASNVAAYIAGTPFSSVQADRLNASAQGGVGVANALVTEVIDVQATATNVDINIYNVGALNLAGTGVNAGINAAGGDVTLVATGAITQSASAAVKGDDLAVITLHSPGADITLTDGGNDAQSYSLFACLALPGGCPSDMPARSTSNTAFGNGSNTNYAAGSIMYRDSNGATLSGIGTISAFSTYTNGDTTITANSISASDITLEASGNITLNLGADLTKINNGGTGSFNLIAGGNITMLDSSHTIGTSGSRFSHALNLTAAGDVTLNESIWQGARNLNITANASGLSPTGNQTLDSSSPLTGNVTMQGNHVVSTLGNLTARGVDFSLLGGNQSDASGQSLNGQELRADTINLLNSGVITVRAGSADATSASGARMRGGTVNIGTQGGASNPIRMLVQGGTNHNFGYVTANLDDTLIELRQPDALVEATGDMLVHLRRDPATLDPFGSPYSLEVRGGTATANDNGGQIRVVTALGAMRATNMTMVADGSVLLQGGTSNLNAFSAFTATNAIILVETEKRLTTTLPGASVIVRGGTANVSSSLSTTSARNALALAQLDPSKLFLDVSGRLVLQGGRHTGPAGSLTSARVDAGDEIRISVDGSPAPYTYTTSGGASNTVTGSFLLIGGQDSGFFDSHNVPLGGGSYPIEFPITVNMGVPSGYARVLDSGLGAAIVQTGLATFDDSLLSYIIFAANEETRAARLRRGLGEGDDLGAPACK